MLCNEYAAGLGTGLRRVMQWHARRRSRHPLSEVRRRRATYRAPGAWRWRRSRTLADFREGEEYKHLTHFVHQRARVVMFAPSGSPRSVCRRVSTDYTTNSICKAAAAGPAAATPILFTSHRERAGEGREGEEKFSNLSLSSSLIKREKLHERKLRLSLAGSSAIKDASQTRALPSPPNTDAVVSVTSLLHAMSTLQVLERACA